MSSVGRVKRQVVKLKAKSSLLLVDADDRIVSDVLCIRCGNNLRDLHVADRCPQCNHPASDSVHGDYLIHADRVMVRGLADAAQVVEYAIAILAALVGLALLASIVTADDMNMLVERAYSIVFAGMVLAPVVATIGLVLLTTRHAAAYYWVRYGNPRAILRMSLLVVLGLTVISLCGYFIGYIALQISIVIWFVIPLGLFFRGLESLMRRVPNNQLATFSRGMLVGLIGFSVLSIVIIFLRFQCWDDPSWGESLTAFSGINTVGGIGLTIASYQLLARVRRTLFSISR